VLDSLPGRRADVLGACCADSEADSKDVIVTSDVMAPPPSREGAQTGPGGPRPPRWVAVLRFVGWLLIVAGAVVGLFIVYLLFWTGRETAVAQRDLLEQWGATTEQWSIDEWSLEGSEGGFTALPESGPVEVGDDQGLPDIGAAHSLLWFERDGERIVTDEVLSTVQGVGLDNLVAGPGHYPNTEDPGQAGNFAISGHRTTYAAPFYDLDRLVPGDEIHVVDRGGRHFVYVVEELRVVQPDDVWVLDDDPLDRGTDHWMTITTCHPRFSAAQRLVAFGSLRGAA
jgi:sortase A